MLLIGVDPQPLGIEKDIWQALPKDRKLIALVYRATRSISITSSSLGYVNPSFVRKVVRSLNLRSGAPEHVVYAQKALTAPLL